MVAALPVSTINILQSPEWKGGPLLTLPDSQAVKTPTSKEVSSNYWFIKPVVQFMPRKVWDWETRGANGVRVWYNMFLVFICAQKMSQGFLFT